MATATGAAAAAAPSRPPPMLDTASLWSRLAFSWPAPLLRGGAAGTLSDDTLPSLSREDTEEWLRNTLAPQWQRELDARGANAQHRPSLWRALWRAFGCKYLLITPVLMVQIVGHLLSVYFLGELIRFFSTPEADAATGWLNGGGLILAGLLNALCHHTAFLQAWRMGMWCRLSLTSLVFRKALGVRLDALSQTTEGAVTNVVSSDVERFLKATQFTHYLWIGPTEAIVVMYLLWQLVGAASLGSLWFLALVAPVQTWFARRFGAIRSQTAAITDKRVRLTTQIIVGARIMKMFAWEPPYVRAIKDVRKQEIERVHAAATLKACNSAVFFVSLFVVAFFVFLTAHLLGVYLTPRSVFQTIALLQLLQVQLTLFLPFAAEALAETRVAVSRIEKILVLPEAAHASNLIADAAPAARKAPAGARDGAANGEGSAATSGAADATPTVGPVVDTSVDIDNVTCRWEAAQVVSEGDATSPKATKGTTAAAAAPATATSPAAAAGARARSTSSAGAMAAALRADALSCVSFRVPAGSLTAVVGAVGSGKSSLLLALARELVPVSGTITTARGARVTYAAQEPFIMGASVKDNILFEAPFDVERYSRVLSCCALKPDLTQLPGGDACEIGARGVNLSGGQRSRIGLARAIYADADIYLLDDPLSAVDTRVGRQLFDMAIVGHLAGKTRVLVTHQLQYLQAADQIVVLEEGRVKAVGSFADVLAQGVDLRQLQEQVEADLHEHEEAASVALSASAAESAGVPDGARGRYRSRTRTTRTASVASSGTDPNPTTTVVGPDDVDVAGTEGTAAGDGGDKARGGGSGGDGGEDDADLGALTVAEERATGVVSWQTWRDYASACGGAVAVTAVAIVGCGCEAMLLSCGAYLSRWSSLSEEEQQQSKWIEGLAWLTAGTTLLSFARANLMFYVTVRAARVLHDAMLSTVVRAPVLFFDQNPSGRILNRFAKDLGFLDDMLPLTMQDFLAQLISVIGRIILVCAVNPWALLTVAPLWFVFVYVRRYYMVTSRDVKRLEAVSRSPVFSLFNECLTGLATVRSFRIESALCQRLEDHMDNNTRAYFSFLAISRWLGMRLDVLTLVFIGATVAVSMPLRNVLAPEMVGLMLTFALQLAASFQWCVRQSAEVENLMISAERVVAYTKLPTEDVDISAEGRAAYDGARGGLLDEDAKKAKALDDAVPASGDFGELGEAQRFWPWRGTINFDRLVMRYREDLPPVLNKLSFSIRAGEKVAVVGRTGAGKSSLLSSLFRLAEYERDAHDAASAGADRAPGVYIDGINTATVPLQTLRSRLGIVTQSPVLFAGTVRSNLDRWNQCKDAELWDALAAVQLKDVVRGLDGGLNAAVADGGSNFSVGQRQLLCLCRVMLGRSRVLVLDEASANIDGDTDRLIQEAIRTSFADATTITVAHRLGTVIDADRVVVLDAGRVVEYDAPYTLLQRPMSAFSDLVAETGAAMASQLRNAAKEAFDKRRAATTAGGDSGLAGGDASGGASAGDDDVDG